MKKQLKKLDNLESVLKTMPMTGECEVDIEKAINAWDKSFLISQFKEHYQLVQLYGNGEYGKVTISKVQAHELIGKLNLVDEQSTVFRSGLTWRKIIPQTLEK